MSTVFISVMLGLNLKAHVYEKDNIERICGLDRYTTGIELSKKIYSNSKKAIIVSGEDSISNKFKRKIKCTRIFGNDRYETAEKIGEKFLKNNGKSFESTGNLIITSGTNYPDALSDIPLSLNKNCPIIFSSLNLINKI